MTERNLGEVKIKTMLVSGRPLDWLGGKAEFGREFPVVALGSLPCLPIAETLFLLH